MKMNPEEITSIIKERIKNYDVDLNVNDVGTVLEVGDGIAHIYGLERRWRASCSTLATRCTDWF